MLGKPLMLIIFQIISEFDQILSLLIKTRSFRAINNIRIYNSGCNPDGVYIHIPFCRRRCYYCDFPIKVVGDRSTTIDNESQVYTDLLTKEIILTKVCSGKEKKLNTIYFGGGTPSLLPDQCNKKP